MGGLRVDLLTIFGVVWRHRLVTALVMVMTAVGSVVVITASPPMWSATTSYLLIEPPLPPTPEQLQEEPRLRQLNSDNPFARYGDPTVIIDVVSRIAATKAVQDDVEEAGGVADFEVLPSTRFGAASPIIDVTVTGGSEERVLSSLALVGDFVGRLLRQVQADEAVSPRYFYSLRQINSPSEGTREFSSTLRLLVGVLALGGLTLIAALSILEGRRRRRRPGPSGEDADADTADGPGDHDDTAHPGGTGRGDDHAARHGSEDSRPGLPAGDGDDGSQSQQEYMLSARTR